MQAGEQNSAILWELAHPRSHCPLRRPPHPAEGHRLSEHARQPAVDRRHQLLRLPALAAGLLPVLAGPAPSGRRLRAWPGTRGGCGNVQTGRILRVTDDGVRRAQLAVLPNDGRTGLHIVLRYQIPATGGVRGGQTEGPVHAPEATRENEGAVEALVPG